MTNYDYRVTCEFYTATERRLGTEVHPVPPRVGDHVWLKPSGEVGWSSWLVTGVWWDYPQAGSKNTEDGKLGGNVTVICTEGSTPWEHR